jgi:diguanylate cyclase (GGDEF)-like protein
MVHVMRQADGALSLEESLHAIMESVKTYFPSQSTAVVLIDDDTNELRIKISRPIRYTFAKAFRRTMPPPSIERMVLEQASMLIARADSASESYADIKLEHDYASAVLAPVIRNQRGVGYIFCDRSASQPAFTESDLLHLQVIGYLVGNLIEKFELLRESKRLSQVDDATGALQYKAFVPALGVEFERARAHGYPVVLALLAVDAFRRYLETYGIDRAHGLLADVATVVKQHTREMDLLARFGADQFILCLSGLNEEQAGQRLTAIRRDVQNAIAGDAGQVVDVAIGAVVLGDSAALLRSLQDILGAVGKALVQAKTAKGRPHIFGSLP